MEMKEECLLPFGQYYSEAFFSQQRYVSDLKHQLVAKLKRVKNCNELTNIHAMLQ